MTLEELQTILAERKAEDVAAVLDRKDHTSEISNAIATLTSRIDGLEKDSGGQSGDSEPKTDEKSIMAYFIGKEV